MENSHPVTTPIYVCDAFASQRFRGNQAAVVMVPSSAYLMEWNTIASLEASFGRGEPEAVDASKTEAEREEAAQAYNDDRHLKMGRCFQSVSKELGFSETAFVFRLPAGRVRKIQEEIKSKAEEFESEYEARVKEEQMTQLMGADDSAGGLDVSGRGGNGGAPKEPTTADAADHVGLIPSASFSMGDFGASFLDTRSVTMSASTLGKDKHRARRLHTQWFGLRWFTPTQEVTLCGHATLAAAHTIFETSRLVHYQSSRHLVDNVPVEFFIPAQTDVLCFSTQSGIITVKRKGDNESSYALNRDSTTAVESYEVHFPSSEATSIDPSHLPSDFISQLLNALQLPYEKVEDVFDEMAVSAKNGYYVLALKGARTVTQCIPNEALLRTVFSAHTFVEARKKYPTELVMPHGLIVTAQNDNKELSTGEAADAQIITRFFAPWLGVLEDPVTGTAYTVVTPYWLRRRQGGSYKVGDHLQCYQASARGGSVQTIIIGKKADRVALIGPVVTFLRGTCTYNVED